jgi:hypothetical protein
MTRALPLVELRKTRESARAYPGATEPVATEATCHQNREIVSA